MIKAGFLLEEEFKSDFLRSETTTDAPVAGKTEALFHGRVSFWENLNPSPDNIHGVLCNHVTTSVSHGQEGDISINVPVTGSHSERPH